MKKHRARARCFVIFLREIVIHGLARTDNSKAQQEKSMDMREFLDKFNFDPSLEGHVGIEREFFLYHGERDSCIPDSPKFLHAVGDTAWTYELSACQVEHRTLPIWAGDRPALLRALRLGTEQGREAARSIECRLVGREVAPQDMPLNVYPDDLRYAEISKHLSQDVLEAACRVAAVHIHYGCSSFRQAILVANRLNTRLDDLIRLGDHSSGERMRLYHMMVPNPRPPHYESVEHLYRTACAQGFDQDPRKCWHLIRISRHGTVEVRVFGMTENELEIVDWVEIVAAIASGR